VPPRKPELFQDVLEDEGRRTSSGKLRVGGASLRPEEFSGGRPQEDVVDRFNILKAEADALRTRVRREAEPKRRKRWTGALWLLGILAAAGLAAAGYKWLGLHRESVAQRELAEATAARRSAEEERILRIQKIPTAPTPSPAAAKQ
jgi:hypothetical protein